MNGGEAEAALGWVPHEFEWHVLGDALLGQDRLEAPPVLQGRQTVVEFFTEMAEVWGWRPEPQEFVDLGDGKIVCTPAES